jgi:hypothetical protein
MWIRSQDRKTLLYCTAIGTVEGDLRIWADSVEAKETYIIGEYPTETETLQVIEAINQHIEALEYYKCVGKDRDMPCPPFVFQMPPAGFSKEVPPCQK